jgi:hypothetical protein
MIYIMYFDHIYSPVASPFYPHTLLSPNGLPSYIEDPLLLLLLLLISELDSRISEYMCFLARRA